MARSPLRESKAMEQKRRLKKMVAFEKKKIGAEQLGSGRHGKPEDGSRPTSTANLASRGFPRRVDALWVLSRKGERMSGRNFICQAPILEGDPYG